MFTAFSTDKILPSQENLQITREKEEIDNERKMKGILKYEQNPNKT